MRFPRWYEAFFHWIDRQPSWVGLVLSLLMSCLPFAVIMVVQWWRS